MPKNIKKYLCALLSLVCLCGASLSACESEKKPVHQGISVDLSTPEYSEDDKNALKESLYSLLYANAKSKVSVVPQATLDKLATYSEDISKIFIQKGMSESEFKSVLQTLQSEDALSAFAHSALSEFISLYGVISTQMGATLSASVCYSLVEYYYDVQYKKLYDRYVNYNLSVYKRDAEAKLAEKEKFFSLVSLSDFSSVLQTVYAVSTFFNGGLESGIMSMLTESEIVNMIKNLKCFDVQLTEDTFEILFNIYMDIDEDSYHTKLLKKAKTNKDISDLCSRGVSLLALVRSIRDKISTQNISLISSSPYKIFSLFSEDDWAIFEFATAPLAHASDYETIAQKTYGDDYKSYKLGETNTLSELKESVSGDGVQEVLLGYLKGNFAYLTYGAQE